MTDKVRELLGAYGKEATALLSRLEPLMKQGKTSAVLVTIAEALRDAANAPTPAGRDQEERRTDASSDPG